MTDPNLVKARFYHAAMNVARLRAYGGRWTKSGSAVYEQGYDAAFEYIRVLEAMLEEPVDTGGKHAAR